MSLDLAKLEKVRDRGNKITARCPACAESGNDSTGDHLSIFPEGQYACLLYPAGDGNQHRARIYELAGIKDSRQAIVKTAPAKAGWTALASAPEAAPFPLLKHFKHGTPSAHWVYKTAEGRIAGIIARLDIPATKDGKAKKEIWPITWCQDEAGNTEWRPKGMAEPCPLYGLPFTDGDGDDMVIVEGEKCADAIRAAGFPATTWAGGSSATHKTDWSPLKGRIVYIWPDNDEPGMKAKDAIIRALSGIAAEIRVVQIPDSKPVGWDAADTDDEEIFQLIDEAKIVETASDEAPQNLEEQDPAERFYYDGIRYHLDTGREFVPLDQKSVSRHMKSWGSDPSQIEAALCQIQIDRHIHFAGPLAGHPRGLHTAGGVKLLATVSPSIIKAEPGTWETLLAVLDGLLSDPDAGEIQVKTFLAWLKIARESLVTNRRRPGQAMALAGPRGSGKSLLIDITEQVLGGRRANPYPYFIGRTIFSADLAGAELLAVDDEAGSTDIRSRKTLAANIKSCLFAGAVRIEGKNKTAFTLRPCWRMVIALNDEPEALLVLPPITEDIGDKITLLRCHKRPLPMPAHTLEERDAFFAKLREEIPAMLAWLEAWEIPNELREERCGVKAYHHPAILSALHELSPEGHMMGLIDTAHAAGSLPLPWLGTAAELKAVLCGIPQTSRDAERLLSSWLAAAGSYLGKLEGERVKRLPMVNGIQRWRVLPSGVVD